jgi:hypothetical protein
MPRADSRKETASTAIVTVAPATLISRPPSGGPAVRYPAGRLRAAVGRHPPVRGYQRLEMRSARRAEGDGASGLHHAHHAQLAEREDAETCRSRHTRQSREADHVRAHHHRPLTPVLDARADTAADRAHRIRAPPPPEVATHRLRPHPPIVTSALTGTADRRASYA